MANVRLPAISERISLNSYVGTVAYVGQVDNTSGTWIGVEWDDAARGKHNGCVDGKRYFSCRSNTGGSFIRPSRSILYNVSFLEALRSKYIEDLHGSDTLEKIVLGSSGGAIEVEAVSLDKIRQKFSRLDHLREVSLDGANIGRGDPPGMIVHTCPNIRGLDLSQNLFQTWDAISEIVKELCFLRCLSLNRNRLVAPPSSAVLAGAFQNIEELQLNDTLLTWRDMQIITMATPRLKSVEFGYNELTNLNTEDNLETLPHPTLQSINLDHNRLSNWYHVYSSLAAYDSLQHIVLTSNTIESIPFPNAQQQGQFSLSEVQHLSLSENRIASWSSLDALTIWLPNLKFLSLRGNPFLNGIDENHARCLIIARVPSLVTLDGTTISSRARTDSEIYYMSSVIKQGYKSEDLRRKEHRRWAELCEKYGKPADLQNNVSRDKLSNRLIDLELYTLPDSDELDVSTKIVLRVLPSMPLNILRKKICKVIKRDTHQTKIRCWSLTKDKALVELETKDDSKSIDWLGLNNGSQIVYQVHLLRPARP